MQRSVIILLALITTISSSFKGDDDKSKAKKQRTAVISIYCNKQISAPGFSEMSEALYKLSHSQTFNLSSTAMKLHDKVFHDYAELFEFSLMKEEEVLQLSKYSELKSEFTSDPFYSNLVMPPGYYGITPDNRTVVQKSFSLVDSADAVMIIAMNYELVKHGIESMEFGIAKIRAFGEVKVIDKEGNKIFKATAAELSDSQLRFPKGGYINEKELMPLIQEATDKTIAEMTFIIKSKTNKG